MSTQDSASVVRAFCDARDQRDADRAVSYLDPKVEWRGPGFPALRDSKAVNEALQGHWAVFPDHREQVTNLIAAGDWVTVEYVGWGTQQAPFDTPCGRIAATGRRVDVSCCDVYEVKSGKIVQIHTYFDMAELLHQLGVVPSIGQMSAA